MGLTLAHVRHTLRNLIIRLLVRALRLISPSMDALIHRLRLSPGIPVSNPSSSYWTMPPSSISRHGSEPGTILPEYADIVIIGSGITGTSFARTCLDHDMKYGKSEKPLRVVMLEARDACSGATGRNGGHITPILYADYAEMKEAYGIDMAKKIIRFRLSHFPQLLTVATEEGLLEDSQCREVEAFDVFYDARRYQQAKSKLSIYQRDLPKESAGFRSYEGTEDIKNLQLSDSTVGCLSTRAGVIHPYRLVTGILSRLLKSYPNSFRLFTHTPCTAISVPEPSTNNEVYNVMTPRGIIRTPHIIHATNGWISHLLPCMRGRILPARGVMTAQTPWEGLGLTPTRPSLAQAPASGESWTGTRSFVFFPDSSTHKYDYLTQQPAPPGIADGTHRSVCPVPGAELMLGGGFAQNGAFLTELGNADDRQWNPRTGEYLSQVLKRYFSADDQHTKTSDDAKVRVRALWSGILGISVDEKPWVGRVPGRVSGRVLPSAGSDSCMKEVKQAGINGDSESDAERLSSVAKESIKLAAPGEWMAAGYSGEGMVHAWLSGKALAYMVLGMDRVTNPSEAVKCDAGWRHVDQGDLDQWFPDVFRVSEERWEDTGIEDLFAAFLL